MDGYRERKERFPRDHRGNVAPCCTPDSLKMCRVKFEKNFAAIVALKVFPYDCHVKDRLKLSLAKPHERGERNEQQIVDFAGKA